MPSSTLTHPQPERETFRLSVTLELDASSDARALLLAQSAVRTLQGAKRGHDEITHAWMDSRARPAIKWCEFAAFPADKCVACQREECQREYQIVGYVDASKARGIA